MLTFEIGQLYTDIHRPTPEYFDVLPARLAHLAKHEGLWIDPELIQEIKDHKAKGGKLVLAHETPHFPKTPVYEFEWTVDGKLHRDNGPAKQRFTEKGEQYNYWYRNGVMHRDNAPAAVTMNGDQFWYKEGLEHRSNGPAVVFASGDFRYYQNGLLHREDGPAQRQSKRNYWFQKGKPFREGDLPEVEADNGERIWLDQEGRKHREGDKPAVIHAQGKKEWFVHGKRYREETPLDLEIVEMDY